jgi:hypothetical protein
MKEPDQARWFKSLGNCSHPACTIPATGIVMGPQNEPMGNYCARHGQTRIRKAAQERNQCAEENPPPKKPS